jgi:hypothetical protein
MALITRNSDASVDTSTAMYAPQITGLLAGEALDACSICYVKTSDGKIYMSNATASNEAAEVWGVCPRAVQKGQAVTLFGAGTRLRYGTSLTVGNKLYLAETAGKLDTAATTGDAWGVAHVVTSTDIIITRALPSMDATTIPDASITNAKMAGDAIDSDQVVDGAVDPVHLSDAANTRIVNTYLGTVAHATAISSGLTYASAVSPVAGVVNKVYLATETAISASATDYWEFAIVNKETGSGTTEVASLSTESSAVSAYVPTELTVSGTPANYTVAAGELLVLTVAATEATGDTLDDLANVMVTIEILPS